MHGTIVYLIRVSFSEKNDEKVLQLCDDPDVGLFFELCDDPDVGLFFLLCNIFSDQRS